MYSLSLFVRSFVFAFELMYTIYARAGAHTHIHIKENKY